jgi:hypothetical protein
LGPDTQQRRDGREVAERDLRKKIQARLEIDRKGRVARPGIGRLFRRRVDEARTGRAEPAEIASTPPSVGSGMSVGLTPVIVRFAPAASPNPVRIRSSSASGGLWIVFRSFPVWPFLMFVAAWVHPPFQRPNASVQLDTLSL